MPSNLLLKKLRPSRWLPTIMVAWGTVMTLMGIVQSYRGLLAARLFLGVAEAGLYPGVAVSWLSSSCFFAFPNFLGRSRSGCIVLLREPYPTPMLFLCCVS